MLKITGVTKIEDEDRQRAATLLAGTPLLHDEKFFERTARALAGARAVEREACAKVAETVQPIKMGWGSCGGGRPAEYHEVETPNPVAQACAFAIRARNVWVSPQGGDGDGS